jgi:hypothetical protein
MSIQGATAPIHSVLEYLSNKDRTLEIPPWQREYVWTPSETGEVGVLLQDLKDFISSDDPDYLLGSVFLSHGADEVQDRLLIDGQQRTLTLTLLLMACRKHISNAKLLKADDMFHATMLVDLLSCFSKSGLEYFPKVIMIQGKANDILKQLFLWSMSADGEQSDLLTEEKEHWTPTQRNLVSVAKWIYEKQIHNENWLKNDEILKGMRKILDNVKFIEVTLSNEQEAIAVFDRINSRGSRLDSGDLVKNRIFQRVPDGDPFDAVTENWTAMMESLVKCTQTRMREPKFLLRALALQDPKIVKEVDDPEGPTTKAKNVKITYEQLVPYWTNRLEGPGGQSAPGKMSAVEFSNRLVLSAKHLQLLSEENYPKISQTRDARLYFTRFLKSVQHYPMLMAGASIKNKGAFETLAKQVFNRTAFYLLSDERNQDFEAIVPSWTAAIFKLGADASPEELKKVYSEEASVTNVQLEALHEALLNWSYKDATERRKIRAVLSLLSWKMDEIVKKLDEGSPESYYRTRKVDGMSWDIDHVGAGGKAEKNSKLHTIGNLVLLHPFDNRSAGDKSAISKFDNYAGSHLYLTKTLAEVKISVDKKKLEKFCSSENIAIPQSVLEEWNDEAIDQRAAFYWSLLKHELTSDI